MMQMLGHDGPPTQFYRENILTGEPLARCPVRSEQLADPALRREVEHHRLTLFPPYRDHGALPVAGGVLDQPARSLDYLLALRAFDQRVEAKYTEITLQRARDGEDDA